MAYTENEIFNLVNGSEVTGESPYDLWKSLGNEGTAQDFLNYLKDDGEGGSVSEEVLAQIEQNKNDISQLSDTVNDLDGLTHGIYVGDTQPTNGVMYWLDTSEDTPVEPDEPVIPDEPDEPEVPEVTLSSISATYNGGEVAVGTALTDLTGITVKATYSDGTTANITDYTLSGTIAEGENTITVSYGGKTTTFKVTGVAESGGDEPSENPNLLESNVYKSCENKDSCNLTKSDLQSLIDNNHTEIYVVGYRNNSEYSHNFSIRMGYTSASGVEIMVANTNTADGTYMLEYMKLVLTDTPQKTVSKWSVQAILSKLEESISNGVIDSSKGTPFIQFKTSSPFLLDKILYSYDANYAV